jgi:hypothetical protein
MWGKEESVKGGKRGGRDGEGLEVGKSGKGWGWIKERRVGRRVGVVEKRMG